MGLVSIIIPLYNVENYLSKCIESVLVQSYTNFELILVNDGSSDRSGLICEEYAVLDSRLQLISQPNLGVSMSRNRGIQSASGKYILFIDSDDSISPDYVQNFMNAIATYPKALIYQGFVNCYSHKKIETRLINAKYFDSEICEALYEVENLQCLGGACNKIFQRDIIIENNILFNCELNYGEDKIFTLQYCQHINSIIFLDTCDYYYNRENENSLSHCHHTAQMLKLLIETEYFIFCSILERYPNKKLREAVNGRYISLNKYVLLSMYRPQESYSRIEKHELATYIHNFSKANIFNQTFIRDVPKFIDVFYRGDLLMKCLMFLRTRLSFCYNIFTRCQKL